MSSFTEYLKKRIAELEEQIQNNSGDLDTLKKELSRVQRMEMEEDLRDSGDQRLLQE
jgi:prefoldin subunit 5